jgi:MFS family permease
VVAIYAFSHIFAGFIAAVITNSTSKIDGEQSWTIPIAIMFVFPGICILMQFLLPESPRWLLRQGRFDEAVAAIYYLNSAEKEYPAELEAQLILETINENTTKGQWKDLFRGRNTVSAKGLTNRGTSRTGKLKFTDN